MRVLMLGWDFSPRLSGGVGSACQGLANALARASERARTDVLFVLPRVRGDEEAADVELRSGADVERAHAREGPEAPVRPRRRAAPAPVDAADAALRAAPPAAVEPGPVGPERADDPAAPPTLPTPAEALRLLALDSPLQPYLTPDEYGALVHARLARIRAAARRPAREAAPPRTVAAASTTSKQAFQRAPQPAAAHAVAPEPEAAPAPFPGQRDLATVPVPPYGLSLVDEVERYARAVLALVQREAFDVIHAHDWMTFPAAMLVKERTGKPLVVHFHSSEPERRGRAGAPDADVRAIEQAALDAADRVICVSEASARVLRAHYAVELAKLRVVHDAFAPLAPPPAAPRARRTPTVLFLGRLSEQKAPDVFLRAAALVRARRASAPRARATAKARFVLAGDGALYPELKQLARTLGLGKSVRFTGFVGGADLARTYAGADVYVLSSAAEPFGIGALEALSLGVPTIVPRGAGVTEVVRSVLRFEPLDEEDLADKIVALIEHPALRRQLAAEGLREVKEIRWDRPARVVNGIYDELVLARG